MLLYPTDCGGMAWATGKGTRGRGGGGRQGSVAVVNLFTSYINRYKQLPRWGTCPVAALVDGWAHHTRPSLHGGVAWRHRGGGGATCTTIRSHGRSFSACRSTRAALFSSSLCGASSCCCLSRAVAGQGTMDHVTTAVTPAAPLDAVAQMKAVQHDWSTLASSCTW